MALRFRYENTRQEYNSDHTACTIPLIGYRFYRWTDGEYDEPLPGIVLELWWYRKPFVPCYGRWWKYSISLCLNWPEIQFQKYPNKPDIYDY